MKKLFPLMTLLIAAIGINALKAQIAWPQNGSNIYYNGGNVGIGTSSPRSTFHIFGTAATLTIETVVDDVSSINFIDDNIVKSYIQLDNSALTSNIWTCVQMPLTFGTNNIERLRINYDGKIGVGTISPNNKLEINHGTPGNSGLRFTQLKSSSPTTPSNGKTLSVNEYGDVILTDGGVSNNNYWGFLGNTGTNPAVNFIGSSDNQDLVIRTNNTERVRVKNTGNVGIGTTAPFAKITIPSGTGYNGMLGIEAASSADSRRWWIHTDYQAYGDFVISTESTKQQGGNPNLPRLYIKNNGNVGIGTTAPYGKLHVFSQNSPSQYYDGELHIGGFIGTPEDITLIIGTHYTNKTTFLQGWRAGSGSTPILLQPQGGNIGIGTTTPSNSLTLSKMSNGANLARITFDGQTGNANNTINGGVEFHNDNYNYYSGIYGYRGDNSSQVGIQLKASSGTAVTILPNMNIGIGVTNPQYKLAVEGTIAAREVKITAEAWADFVFHPSYKLRTLGEVEQFIKTNSHLPEIPTEKEVKENGIGVGEMNAKLLQKIEELTLYIIEQNKRIEALESKTQNNK